MLFKQVNNTACFEVSVKSEEMLKPLVNSLIPFLKPSDFIALRGDLGAGKTTFTRVLIQELLNSNVQVPSPTYTFVQEYESHRGRIAHYDLYRLQDLDELEELGWYEALSDAICLVEWPERIGAAQLPESRLELNIAPLEDSEERVFTFSAVGDWQQKLLRLVQCADFLSNTDWRLAQRKPLHGDASSRRYEKLLMDKKSAIFMDSPQKPDGPIIRNGQTYSEIAHLAENILPFVAIDKHLRSEGFYAPEIYDFDLNAGFIVLEDLGDQTLLKDGKPDQQRYLAAVDQLIKFRSIDWPEKIQIDPDIEYHLPLYDLAALKIETELLIDWYPPAKTLGTEAKLSYLKIWDHFLEEILQDKPVWVLRDFHSPNVHWIEEAEDGQNIGLIDFQDTVLGHPAYDLVSLAQDARVDIAPEHERQLLDHYLNSIPNEDEKKDFQYCYSIMGAQRNSKILGIFHRLSERDGKHGYLKHIPRIKKYLIKNLQHPELSQISNWYHTHLPELFE